MWTAEGLTGLLLKNSRTFRAKCQLPRNPFCPGCGSGCLCHPDTGHSSKGYRGDPLTLPRLFVFTGAGDTFLRVERHVENALKVVEYLNAHPQVEAVHHPSVTADEEQKKLYEKYFPNGGGSIFTFEIKEMTGRQKSSLIIWRSFRCWQM